MKRYRLSAPAALAIGVMVTIGAIVWFSMTTYPISRAVFIVFPGIAFTAMLLQGSDSVIEKTQRWMDAAAGRIAVVPAGMWLLYIAYAWGMGIATPTAAITMAIYLGIPFLVFGL